MAVPKRRTSRSRRNNRRSHDAISAPALYLCPRCKSPKLPHRVCPNCGTYRGRDVLKIEEE
ncbi:50S ribosomal protein L32 [Thermodesulforhabdus norvegica]|uniref:Large ribosomal subunit protein bL32 n=1 Tax=Thermodesulforhabdus norvegica TaxID=39841 RepID=A0A1I4SXF9_9BACT|nr:50S ribosomal protein L32 [Thermodesulforhabdus norvegica]SFM69085.1 LSU ribosomal protein L32P [Thermodesulforhabdus norvegica]